MTSYKVWFKYDTGNKLITGNLIKHIHAEVVFKIKFKLKHRYAKCTGIGSETGAMRHLFFGLHHHTVAKVECQVHGVASHV